MPSLLQRLRDALAPRYEVEAEVATGGMATVFRALDTSLGRVVAVKVLRPDLATATAEERFRREARTLASFSHPNMVPIHDVGEADGLSYYVMDFVEGETLAARIGRGPLDGRDCFRLGRDLLEALARIHEAGVVHRDVKPSNVFLVEGRALLADFGVAHVGRSRGESLTGTGGPGPGTPAYMSPEQRAGDPVSGSTDVYAVGLVLYEALTGRRWPIGLSPDAGDWRDVPMAARGPVRRALALDPAARWPDAASFRAALRTRGPGVRVPRWSLLVAGTLALSVFAVYVSLRRAASPGLLDVAVFPCRAVRPADSAFAYNIGYAVAINLENQPRLSTASRQAAFSLFLDRSGAPTPADWTEHLRASHATRCTVDRSGTGLAVDLRLLAADGRTEVGQTFIVDPASSPDPVRDAASRISILVLQHLADVTLTEEEVDRLARHPIEAISHFFAGEEFLRRGAWRSAEESYAAALELAPSFALARLRRAEARRWLAHRAIGEDLSVILRADSATLSPLNRLLLEARALPHGPAQLTMLESILGRPEYRWHPYVTLLYADELYHRGSLWGIPLDSGVTMLDLAVRRDSFLVPAVEHLTQALIRTGRRDEAEALLPHLRAIHAPADEVDVYYPDVWTQGWLERFDAARAESGRAALASAAPDDLALYARWVRYIDSPATQIVLGRRLVEVAGRERAADLVAEGFIAQGLGHITRGRIAEGLAAFDSAAARLRDPRTTLQAAEWRVVPFALGLEGFTEPEAERGETALLAVWEATDATDVSLRARAAWALALLAERRDDAAAREEWSRALQAVEAGRETRLARLLAAERDARAGRPREALETTAPDVAYDSAGLVIRPFYRSALYLLRGAWYLDLGLPDSAAAAWLWHENTDLEGTVAPFLVQAGEVDGALGVHGRLRFLRASSRDDLTCSRAADVLRLWGEADPVLRPLAREVERRLETCTP